MTSPNARCGKSMLVLFLSLSVMSVTLGELLDKVAEHDDLTLPGELHDRYRPTIPSSAGASPLRRSLHASRRPSTDPWHQTRSLTKTVWECIGRESTTMRRVLYKSNSQHKGAKHLQHLQQVATAHCRCSFALLPLLTVSVAAHLFVTVIAISLLLRYRNDAL